MGMTLANHTTISATVRSSAVFMFPVLLWNRGLAITLLLPNDYVGNKHIFSE